jgi:hypothetical protein
MKHYVVSMSGNHLRFYVTKKIDNNKLIWIGGSNLKDTSIHPFKTREDAVKWYKYCDVNTKEDKYDKVVSDAELMVILL